MYTSGLIIYRRLGMVTECVECISQIIGVYTSLLCVQVSPSGSLNFWCGVHICAVNLFKLCVRVGVLI